MTDEPTHEDPRAALKRAHDLYERIDSADPTARAKLTAPGARLKAFIEAELIELELIAQGMGI